MALASEWDNLEICGLDLIDIPPSMHGEHLYICFDFPSSQIPTMSSLVQQVSCYHSRHVHFPELILVPLGIDEVVITVHALHHIGSELIYKVQVSMKDVISTTQQTRTYSLHSSSPRADSLPNDAPPRLYVHMRLGDSAKALFAVPYSDDWAAVMQASFLSRGLTPNINMRAIDWRGSRLRVRWYGDRPELDPVPEPSNFPLMFQALVNSSGYRRVPLSSITFGYLIRVAGAMPATFRKLRARYAVANAKLEQVCHWLNMWEHLGVLRHVRRHSLLQHLCSRSDLVDYVLCFLEETDENSLMQAFPDVLSSLVWISCRHRQYEGPAARLCNAVRSFHNDDWNIGESAHLLGV
eukprot:TRINITY_DN24358_c0_g1_i1.p1 TRINITY_DN24358_c0_g1~~TRINITY_DN24358_c0_g1_i1.p1  ORF type:complete len:398 (-),score=28.38 TRINITY_DN24358_c0_g1_i1:333-1388(-)